MTNSEIQNHIENLEYQIEILKIKLEAETKLREYYQDQYNICRENLKGE